jgi:hypothetical protein
VTEQRYLRVFLAGEGSNELGRYADHPAYRDKMKVGVLEALLARVEPTGWEVVGAVKWKDIRKFRMGHAAHADTHNVMGAANDAREAGCEVLAFTRDRDNDMTRPPAIAEGVYRASTAMASVGIVGCCACPTLEGWMLALLGKTGTESMSSTKASAELAAEGIPSKDGAAMVAVVENAELDRVSPDAESLLHWLEQARSKLGD